MESTSPEAQGYRFGDIEVDARRHRVLRGGVELALEPKAHAVLVELLRHSGEVVGRDALLDSVWGHRHVTPAVLNRIVAILRRELHDDADHPRWIRTMHGVGYEFIGALEAPNVAPSASSRPAEPQPSSPPSSRRWRAVSWALALLAVVAASASWILWPRPAPSPAANTSAQASRVAVLPLANLSGDAEQRFLADGLSDSLITTLSQFEGLKVIGRSSSFQLRDSHEDAKTIGARLGVGHLIEGSVQRVDDNLRVGIEVVRTTDGVAVWTRRFDRSFKDLFALQDEIALAVAGALQVKLLHRMPGAVETGRPASGNLEAYAAYLRGTDYMLNEPQKAIEQFAQATRLDPDYAQAWSWLAFVRTLHARDGQSGEAARAAYAQARKDIETALRLEPDFGQAHAIRANLFSTADHEWSSALAEFHVALSQVSDTDPTHGAVSRLLATLGKVNESIAERRKYIDGDPLAAFARVYLATLLASVGRLNEAGTSMREATELEPDKGDWYASRRSYLAILRGDAGTALAEAKRISPDSGREIALTLALQIGSDRAAADAALRRLVEPADQGHIDAYAIARVHALRGDADQTFEWLQRDRENDGFGVHQVLFDPLLLRFRDDPRFAAYCKETGLPPPGESEALGIDRIRAALVAKGGAGLGSIGFDAAEK
jgi:TolB-like protein/DNA-binding winged helix-turn-helix (wHTH) protein/Tfp pilus assembly protein PilF